MRATVSLLFAASAVAAFGQGSQITVSPGEGARNVDRDAVRIVQRLGEQVPLDAKFTDREGNQVPFGSLLEGRPSLVLPIFYRCTGVCNLELRGAIETLRRMSEVQVGRDLNVIIVGIHPKETPDLARAKFVMTMSEGDWKGTENGWKFLVGDRENIARVTGALGFSYVYNERKDTIDHPSGVMFLTPDGKVSSYIYGAVYTPQAFRNSLGYAKRSESAPKAQEIFFGCIHVDPITGERSFVIRNILKVLGFLTLGIMGLTFMVLTGRARLRRASA